MRVAPSSSLNRRYDGNTGRMPLTVLTEVTQPAEVQGGSPLATVLSLLEQDGTLKSNVHATWLEGKLLGIIDVERGRRSDPQATADRLTWLFKQLQALVRTDLRPCAVPSNH
jgi:hypothetical protein